MFYLWTVYLVILAVLYAIFSIKASETYDWWPVWTLFGLGCLGIWPIVARYSTNLFFDGLLYDVILIVGFFGTLVIMKYNYLGTLQWIGFGMALVGLILLRIEL